jgi:uncharacterized protein involved in exopolysaccharide biosynthesis
MSTSLIRELEDEQEVDLRSAWQRIADRWWLPAAGVVAGAVAGILFALAGGDVYRAETILYRGLPFSPGAGGQIVTLGTNPRAVDGIVRSETALRAAAAASGLPLAKLRSGVRSEIERPEGQEAGSTPLTAVIVAADAPPARLAKAADMLAQRVIDETSAYVDTKIRVLERQVARATTEVENIEARIDRNLATQQEVLRNQELSLVERLLLNANLNATLGQLEARRGAARENLSSGTQFLSLARDVERARIIEPAVVHKEARTSSRNAAVIGALIGLVLGVLAAYLAEPILARRSARAAG